MSGTDDELWGNYEFECQACDVIGQVNDLMLCQQCAEKLERDMIRQRDWAYSSNAFGLSAEGREELYRQIVRQYGEELELIAPSEKSGKDKVKRKER